MPKGSFAECLRVDRLALLPLQVLDQLGQIVVFGDDQSQLLRVFERGVDMSCPAMEAEEGH